MIEHAYRPDVDGLRAVAVGLVLLFHGNLLFPGGFVGVDVFFVISGFLITGLILKQQRAGTFSLKDFWIRRIRRILPASLLVTAVTLAAGALLLFPDDYKELAQSALAQLGVGANIFFWRHTGYFGGAADLKPLLHTWSLAVEEQFYLIYPFVLVILGRFRRRVLANFLVIGILASVGLAEWGVRNSPTAAFYLLPPRAWEMLLGGLICFLPSLGSRWRLVAEGLGLMGFSMILGAALAFDSNTPFPGLAALVPCLGAALLIYSSVERLTIMGRVLALRPVVFVGLISYSLYLWHWPLFAYARYWLGEELSTSIVLAILAGSWVLAVLSWKFVETPVRRSTSWGAPGRVAMRTGMAVPVVGLLALLVVGSRGWPGRFPPQIHEYLAARDSKGYVQEVFPEDVHSNALPTFGDREGYRACLIWGDSHAMALVPGLDAACRDQGVLGYQATHSSTPPLLGLNDRIGRYGMGPKTAAFNNAVAQFAIDNQVDAVFLGGVWSTYAWDTNFESQLTHTVNKLHAANIRLIIVLDVAWHEREVPLHLAQRRWWGLENQELGVSRAEYAYRNQPAEQIIRRVAQGKALIADPADCLIDPQGIWLAERKGTALYCDAHHLSKEGSLALKPMFEQALQQILGPEKMSSRVE